MSHKHYLEAPSGDSLHYPLDDAYSLTHGIYITEAKPGYAAIAVDVKPYMINAFGTVHGGLIALLADDASGIASHTLVNGAVTMGLSLNYLKGARDCKQLKAIGKIRHGGRSTQLVDVEISDQDGQLIATGTASYFVIEA